MPKSYAFSGRFSSDFMAVMNSDHAEVRPTPPVAATVPLRHILGVDRRLKTESLTESDPKPGRHSERSDGDCARSYSMTICFGLISLPVKT